MTDPVRWLEGDEPLTPDERRALEADVGHSPPPGAKHAVWGVLAVKLTAASAAAAATGTAAGGAGTSAAVSVTTLSLLKFGGVGVALGVFTSGALFVAERPAAPVARDLVAHASAAPASSVSAEPVRVVRRREAVAAAPVAAVPVDVENASAEQAVRSEGAPAREASAEPPLRVGSESQRVARARALLRAGDAPQALRSLLALELEEPSGLLMQEREALLIEALSASGQQARARERAARFLVRFPSSPHASAVRRVAE